MTRPGVSAEHFFHLDGYNGWNFARSTGKDLNEVVVTAAGLALSPGALPVGVVAPDIMSRTTARGLAFDRLGRAFAVAEDHRSFCIFGGRAAPPTECITWEKDARIGGVAIDRRGRMFVAFPELGEVRVFRLSPAGEVGRITLGRPVALAIDSRDRLVVLDLGEGGASSAVNGVDVDLVRIVRDHGDAIAVSATGAIAIVTRGSPIVDFAADGPTFTAIDLGRPALPAVAFAIDEGPEIILLVGDSTSGRIVRWTIAEDKATAVAWSAQVEAWSSLAYRGARVQGLGRDCIPVPVEMENDGFFVRRGQVVVGPLDAGIPDTEWHRITALIDPAPSAGVGVTAEILAVDDLRAFDPSITIDDPRWESPRNLVAPAPGRPAELAFQSARGRYAYVRLTLFADGRHTPRVRWVRVEYPRNSYLRFLPSIYSEDPASRAFTSRFLSLFEAENADLSRAIDELSLLFRPLSVKAEFLPWLAERLDVLLEPDWPIEKIRRVLANALKLYQRRGTREAMLQMLETYGAPGVRLVEGSRERAIFLLGGGHLGCDSVLPGGCKPPRMQLDRGIRLGQGRLDASPYMEADPIIERSGELTVFIPPAVASDQVLERVSRIAMLEAPAGTVVKVMKVKARSQLGTGARLGLDAALGNHAVFRLAAEGDLTALPLPMLLTRETGFGANLALGNGPRLGMDSTL